MPSARQIIRELAMSWIGNMKAGKFDPTKGRGKTTTSPQDKLRKLAFGRFNKHKRKPSSRVDDRDDFE